MNIIFINTYENQGGASIAANRLMKCLKRKNIDVKMLVLHKMSNNHNVYSLNTNFLKKKLNYLRFIWERIIIYMHNGLKRKTLFQVSYANTGTDISKHPFILKADIIHLHWINQGMLSYKDISKLTSLSKPIIWTMHDMWALTGICHYTYGCKKYKDECGECPFLQSNNKKDLSHKGWKKKTFLMNSKIYMVAVSSWLKEKAIQSSLIKTLSCQVIPNVIDLSLFKPGDKIETRKKLSLPIDKKIVLMGAARLDDPIKGFCYLQEALLSINKVPLYENNITLVLFGDIKDKNNFLKNIEFPHIYMGKIVDQNIIKQLYNCADVTVIPSLYETFGQTIIESMASGCPVVTFGNSGQKDIIDHLINGYLAKYKNIEDLIQGIKWGLENSSNKKIINAMLSKIHNCYSEEVISESYLSLYNEIRKA